MLPLTCIGADANPVHTAEEALNRSDIDLFLDVVDAGGKLLRASGCPAGTVGS